MKPNPIVTTLSMSFCTAALTNNRVKPLHTKSTRSTAGILSVSPLITAKRLGMVAACNTITASQPNVSADMWLTLAVAQDLNSSMVSK